MPSFRWCSPHISICWAQLSDSGGSISLLSAAFAIPAAYGDLAAAILAVVAISGLVARASWAIPAVWVFNVWGTLDLLHAIYQGQIGVRIGPGSLGAAFFIPTVVVPPLLVIHGLIFWLLLSKQSSRALK